MEKICFIPARLESSRFKGKPLTKLNNKPMIQWVYEACSKAEISDIYIATPNQEIIDFCNSKNYKSILTSHSHKRGIDRIYEAYNSLQTKKKDDLIVVMQGDEPTVIPNMINKIISFHQKIQCDFALTGLPIVEEEFNNPDVVKLAYDDYFKTIYTSRAPIPYSTTGSNEAIRIFGLYTFTPEGLSKFYSLPPNRLENLESCDTNRILGSDLNAYVCIQRDAPKQQAVDRYEDVMVAEKLLSNTKF